MKADSDMNGSNQGSISGMLATVTGVLISLLPYLEIALRITSLSVGLAIGCITLYRMLRKKRHKP